MTKLLDEHHKGILQYNTEGRQYILDQFNPKNLSSNIERTLLGIYTQDDIVN